MRKLANLVCIAGLLWCGEARAIDTDGDSLDDADEIGDFDGDGTDDWLDTDDDNDLVPTLDEVQRAPQNKDTDGDGAVDWLDADDDADGLLTMLELGPGGGAAPRDTDQDGKFDYLDDDDDNDGEPTATERQSAPPEPDVNHNNVPDYLDPDARGSEAGANPNEGSEVCAVPSVTDAGLPVCWDQDHDGDGIWSSFEGAPSFKLDTDGDGTPDFLDADDDGDGLPTKDEEPDPNHDGNPDDCRNTSGNNADYLNPDDDDDLVPTKEERPEGKDRDTDLDGRPNHVDDDDDGDGISTRTENSGPDGIAADANHNGVPAYLDPDEKYIPPAVQGAPAGAGDGGVGPIATLDAGGAPASSDAGARSDAGASSSRDAGDASADDEEDPLDGPDADDPSVDSGKGSGCALSAPREETPALSALTAGLCALAWSLRRRRS